MDEDPDVALKKEAEDLKAQGNVAYKARKFEEAVGLYEKAWEIYPKDVTFLTNLSGEYIIFCLAVSAELMISSPSAEITQRSTSNKENTKSVSKHVKKPRKKVDP